MPDHYSCGIGGMTNLVNGSMVDGRMDYYGFSTRWNMLVGNRRMDRFTIRNWWQGVEVYGASAMFVSQDCESWNYGRR